MKLTVTMFVSLDGVVQGPGSPDEDRTGGFTRGGWVAPYFDEDMGRQVEEWFRNADAFLLGRNTFEIFADYWPAHVDPNAPIAHGLNTAQKYVVSTTMASPTWEPTTVIAEDVPGAVAELKERPGRELQVHGSAQLVRTLHTHDLVDVYRIITFPVVIGDGERMFPHKGVATGMRLASSRVTASGVVAAEYEPTGRAEFRSIDD